MPPCAYFTPSACVSASTSSISKPSVESALKSYNAVSEKYLSAVATMSSLHTLSPANMITPSATIENIARYLPRLCLISRSEVFFIADFISYTPPYHSISSTGTMCSFLTMDVTVPFFTVITLSAMAVRALLWVMTTTVLPSLRQVSCKSFNTCLPVA